MFITNNHATLHLWCRENLVKHQKLSKYYDQDRKPLELDKLLVNVRYY